MWPCTEEKGGPRIYNNRDYGETEEKGPEDWCDLILVKLSVSLWHLSPQRPVWTQVPA